MPLYAFRCTTCGHEFETLARFEETPACPACGAEQTERQLSLIARPAAGGESEAPGCAAMNGGAPCGPACPAFAAHS
jgi:putative FmdB family regulatory protein